MWLKLFAAIVSIHFATSVILQELLTIQTKNEELKKCVVNVSELNFGMKEDVLYSHWNKNVTDLKEIGSKYPTQVYHSRGKTFRVLLNIFIKFSAYVIVVKTTNLEDNLKVLASMIRFNPRAKFIIILEGSVSINIWRILVRYYIINVVVVQTEDLELFTYFPYKYENLREPDLETFNLGSCWDYDTSKGSLSLGKIPKQWRNTTIIVAYMPLKPYVLNVTTHEGIEVKLVDMMSDFMKYNVSYSTVQYFDWGVYFATNHTYSGPISAIQNYEADFVIGHFHLREEERIIDFDTTFSYMDDDICWIVPIASIRSHWQNIMNIFNTATWWMTIISMFLSYVAWQFFTWGSPYTQPAAYRYYQTPWCSMEVPFLHFLGLPIVHEPKSWATRFLLMVIFVFCFILVTGWKSYLIDSLTHDISEYQIQNLRDIINSKLIFGVYYELIDLQCAEGTPEGDYVCENADRHICDASHACLNRVAYQADMVTIATKRILRYMSPQHYRTESGREMLYLFKQCMGKDLTVQYYTKGHPLFQRSNDLLLWIRTSGFVDNLDDRLTHEIELSFQEYMKGRSNFEISVLGLMHVQGMFFLLLGGLLAAAVVFCLELIVYKRRYQVGIYLERCNRFLRRLWRMLSSRIE